MMENFVPWVYMANQGKLLKNVKYSARRLIRSRIIESAAYCNQPFIVIRNCLPFYPLTVDKTSRLIEAFGCCYHFYVCPK